LTVNTGTIEVSASMAIEFLDEPQQIRGDDLFGGSAFELSWWWQRLLRRAG
jgi:hypothetical protein